MLTAQSRSLAYLCANNVDLFIGSRVVLTFCVAAAMSPSPPVGGVEITTARDRLTTALRMLVDQTDGSSEAAGTAESSSESKAVVKKEKA